MIKIIARHFDPAVMRELVLAAAQGVAEIELSDNSRVVVIDIDLWRLVSERLPSFWETLREIRSIRSETSDNS
jgi:hypothetical protein